MKTGVQNLLLQVSAPEALQVCRARTIMVFQEHTRQSTSVHKLPFPPSGNKRISSLEKEFDTVFGLYCQVCYTDAAGHRYYTSGSSDTKTLSSFNKECEKAGCKKGDYR